MKVYVLYYSSGYEGIEMVGVVDSESSAMQWVEAGPYHHSYTSFYINDVEF